MLVVKEVDSSLELAELSQELVTTEPVEETEQGLVATEPVEVIRQVLATIK